MKKVDDLEQAIERSKDLIKSLEERGYKADGERQLLSWLEELQNFRKDDMLSEIETEIKHEISRYTDVRDACEKSWCQGKVSGFRRILEIVDKYKRKSKGV